MTSSFLSPRFVSASAFPFASQTFKPRSITLAVLCTFAASMNAYSDTATSLVDNADLDPIVITGARFPTAPDLVPIGATVITAVDIRNAGIDNVNEAIRKLAGVYGRKNLYGSSDYDLDLSGFGTNSANNLVVVLDGVRLSENDMSTAMMSSISIDSIARIEITRGASSVLYGDGATGGVIQITTKQLGASALAGNVFVEYGQFNDRTGRASITQGGENFNASLYMSEEKSDNYRDNNALTQKNVTGVLTWFTAQGRLGIKGDWARQDSGFAGSLTMAQFEQNPRQTKTPFNNGATDLDRYTAFFEHNLGAWQLAAEVSTRDKTTNNNWISTGSVTNSIYKGRQTQFTPRVRNLANWDGVTNEFVTGVDVMNWNRQATSNSSSTLYGDSVSQAYATQKSQAIYFRDELRINQARMAIGARRELFDKSSVDPDPYAIDNYNSKQAVNAWELQGSYAFAPGFTVFAKAGQSYRVANVDDNGFVPVANTPLLTQLSHDSELGATLGVPSQQITARLFRHNLTNEIYYDPDTPNAYGGKGANTNLDPTRRQGFALDAKVSLSEQYRLIAQYQRVNAEFTEGVNAGKEMTMVPKNTLSAHLNWIPGDGQTAYVGAQWVDKQRYGSDFNNTCSAQMPSYSTLDARYSKTIGAWEVSVAGDNLANKKYYTQAFSCMGGIYPSDGRQLKASLRYSF